MERCLQKKTVNQFSAHLSNTAVMEFPVSSITNGEMSVRKSVYLGAVVKHVDK